MNNGRLNAQTQAFLLDQYLNTLLPGSVLSFLVTHVQVFMPVSDLAFRDDSLVMGTCSTDGTAKLWNLDEGKPLQTRKLTFGAYCIAFTPDGKAVVTGHDNHLCYITPLTSS